MFTVEFGENVLDDLGWNKHGVQERMRGVRDENVGFKEGVLMRVRRHITWACG
jgi:hypothetical protein